MTLLMILLAFALGVALAKHVVKIGLIAARLSYQAAAACFFLFGVWVLLMAAGAIVTNLGLV